MNSRSGAARGRDGLSPLVVHSSFAILNRVNHRPLDEVTDGDQYPTLPIPRLLRRCIRHRRGCGHMVRDGMFAPDPYTEVHDPYEQEVL